MRKIRYPEMATAASWKICLDAAVGIGLLGRQRHHVRDHQKTAQTQTVQAPFDRVSIRTLISEQRGHRTLSCACARQTW